MISVGCGNQLLLSSGFLVVSVDSMMVNGFSVWAMIMGALEFSGGSSNQCGLSGGQSDQCRLLDGHWGLCAVSWGQCRLLGGQYKL